MVTGAIDEIDLGGDEGDAGEDGDGGADGFGSGFTGLVDTNALASEALIEEPVASGGDSSLWTDGEDDGEQEDCPADDQTCKDKEP